MVEERKISANHKSIVDQFQSLTLEFESTRKAKDELSFELSKVNENLEVKIKEMEHMKDENSNKLFEAEEQITLLNVNLETAQKEVLETKNSLGMVSNKIII